ncbi:MAG TPA: hypothetical protein VJT54_16760 [Verrucomicrobiae bacterium]|nr:hypothetical protein [Verrucomicrobiae bacterium]
MLEQTAQITPHERDTDSRFRPIRRAPVALPETAVKVAMAAEGKGKQ